VSFGDRFYSGESNAWAQYGLLGAEAHGFFSGSSDSLLVEGSEAYGMFSERFTFTSDTLPAGASGSIAIRFAMAGDLEAPVNGTSTVILNYRQNTGGIFTLMNAQVDPRFEPRLNPPNDGFTLTQNSISGAGTFQTLFRLPIVFGTPFDFTAAMLAAALPGNGGPFTADFSLGARVSGFDVFDANGDPVTDFVIASGSGTGYDANGVQLP
jgi:hypothetical protein